MPALSFYLLVFVVTLSFADPGWAQEAKGWLGVEVRDVAAAEADKLGWDAPRGAMLTKVPERGSPAAQAGLKAGDIILSMDGLEVETATALMARLAAKPGGSEIRLRVHAAGRERTVLATLTEAPKSQHNIAGEVPQLMLDTGGHMGLVRAVAFTADTEFLVSAADDKTMRVWDLRTGRTVRIIRGDIQANGGQIYAMALSPDGRWLAAGGLLAGSYIRVYEFASGKLVTLLKGHSSSVFGLAFSPDGRYLISGSADKTAIIWEVASGQLLHRITGHAAEIYAVGFSPNSAIAVTGSYDATLRLSRVSDGSEIAVLRGHADKIFALAVSPHDGTIASGGRQDGEIRFWDGATGEFRKSITMPGGGVGSLRFTPDGKWLLSSCGEGCRRPSQHVWEVESGRETTAYKGHKSLVLAAAISPDGQFAATGDALGEIRTWKLQSAAEIGTLSGMGKPAWSVGFSGDGHLIGWGRTAAHKSYNERGPIEFGLRLPQATRGLGQPELLATAEAGKMVRAQATHGALTLSHTAGGPYKTNEATLEIRRDGSVQYRITRGSSDGYGHQAYSFTVDGQTIISGGVNGYLATYDLSGRRLGSFAGHDGAVWALAPSPDERFLASASGDQTIRLWNLKSRELVVTLFNGSNGEWVVWTPQGYYTGSPGADKIVGWQINKGPDNAAEYVGADQLRHYLNRPDIVEKAIILASAEQAVRNSPGTIFKLADLLDKPVPKFRILSPANDGTMRGGRAQITVVIEAVPNPIKAIRVQVNARQVSDLTPDTGAGGFTGELVLDLPLGKGRNEVRVTLTNDIGERAETVTLQHEGDGDLDKRGTLYILAVGVDRYQGLGNTCGELGNQSCDLQFSGADALKLAKSAELRLGPSHTRVVQRVLVNGASASDAPTANNIIDAIDMLREARETDTVLLFIAGHGHNEGPSYRFLATNAERSGDSFRGVTVVPWQLLQDAVERAKGRRILFIDTCHSGNAYNQTLGNAAYHANVITYTSARFDQEALEDARLGHGLFTYAVSEVLDGRGEFADRREISTKALAEYVIRRVDQLAKAINGAQEPQYFKGRDAEDYTLVRR